MQVPFGPLHRLANALRGWPVLEVWYHPEYRTPLSSLEAMHGVEPRRADYVAWYLLERRLIRPDQLRQPERIGYRDLALVHGDAYLESLHDAEALARIFGVDPSDVTVEPLLSTIRLACGATVEAARSVLGARGRTRHALNLLGGFHHAGRSRGGGNCAVNDVAVALAVVRRDGFSGRAWVVDLDAHPPDGTLDCLQGDGRVKIGSLSGSDWGPLSGPGIDETVLPAGCGDAEYLAALRALLDRMGERPHLAFVIAGGDVVRGDQLGMLGLTERGVRRRDALVAEALHRVPAVWLPGGGYRKEAWRVLAGTALVLLGRPGRRISPGTDPLTLRFAGISRDLTERDLSDRDELITQEDLAELFGGSRDRTPRLLGFYTEQGLEHALHRYGFMEQLERLGYSRFRVAVDATGAGDRLRVFGRDDEQHEHLLVEVVVAKKMVAGAEVLFVNWLTLRHPRARFSPLRPALPGQDVPGLGMAREAMELLMIMARRQGLEGIAFRPSWYHMAYAARRVGQFADPAREGRFQAMLRDLREMPLLEATQALAAGRVLMNGAPYAWEADDMVQWARPDHARVDEDAVRAERERVAFMLRP
ncbi:MAG TPA: histone deacetylase [Myxococcales bacterium]|nr:histone deacetylase [Myxococcales bacterium]